MSAQQRLITLFHLKCFDEVVNLELSTFGVVAFQAACKHKVTAGSSLLIPLCSILSLLFFSPSVSNSGSS